MHRHVVERRGDIVASQSFDVTPDVLACLRAVDGSRSDDEDLGRFGLVDFSTSADQFIGFDVIIVVE